MAATNKVRPPRPIGAFVIMIVLAGVLYACSFIQLPSLNLIPDYATWFKECAEGNVLAKIAYAISDWGDPDFQKTVLGTILMWVGCLIGLYMGKKSKCTFGVCYGSGLFWQVLIAQAIASVGSVFLYHSLFLVEGAAFVPTFIAVPSFAPAIVLKFGGEWQKILTAGIMGIFMGCPFAYFVNVNFVTPLGLPGAVAWVTPMIVSGYVSIEVCKYLPWMARQESDPPAAPAKESGEILGVANAPVMNNEWFIKRVFADFSEPIFYGNEWAGFLFVVGGIITIFLNPANPNYGDGRGYFVILASQILCSAIGVFVYWHRYYELGWYNTFVPIASLTPAFVLAYGTDIHVVIVGALIGGIFMPPVADWIARTIAKDHHGYIGSVFSMFVCCIVFIAIFNFVPGFGV